jgi:hypothetical protein
MTADREELRRALEPESVRKLPAPFYKTVDVMNSAHNSDSKLMSIWADDMKAVEAVMLFLEKLRDGGAALHEGERGSWALHKQPADCIVDHKYSIWYAAGENEDSEPVILANCKPEHEQKLFELVGAANAAALRSPPETVKAHPFKASLGTALCTECSGTESAPWHRPPVSAAWQPIETAPKDGSPILGFMPKYFRGKGGQSVILWLDMEWSDMGAHPCDPSHWMPLPAAPDTEGR